MPIKEILEPSVPPRIGSQIGVIPAFSMAALATLLPGAAVPEHTCGRQGFFMLMSMETQVDTGKMNYIIRDHDKELFEAKKAFFLQAGQTLNEIYGREVCEVSVKDQYYNMYDIIKDNKCVQERPPQVITRQIA